MPQEQDKGYLYFAIFAICYLAFFMFVFPIIDEQVLHNGFRKFLCDNHYVLAFTEQQRSDVKGWCDNVK